ncbi:MAG: dihydrodipicolinate synthase family protein [Chloroflexota bacterium]|nr:dihydrodipicolinate synthase family protein [Chloroflexota bacterium]
MISGELQLQGVIPPMITPLDEDERVDVASVHRVVAHMLKGGVGGIFALGTAGEGPAIREEERGVLLEAVVGAVGGRVPVLAGCMTVSTQRALDYAREAADCGADAVVMTPPFYYGTEDQNVLLEHYTYLADQSPLPVIMYNIPGMTHAFLEAETAAELGEREEIVAVKDSSADMEHLRRLIPLCEASGLKILQGSERALIESLELGVHGLVSASANVAPQWFAALWDAFQEGDMETVHAYDQKAAAYREGVYGQGYWLSCLKMAMNVLGLCQPVTTRPIPPVDAEQRERIRATLERVGLT